MRSRKQKKPMGHEAAFPRWDARFVDEDMLGAILISGEWTRYVGSDRVSVRDSTKWVKDTLRWAYDMAMSRLRNAWDRIFRIHRWPRDIAILIGQSIRGQSIRGQFP
ncbi:hypothetical protein M0804_013969 [Polistes exclamans]|nr:hypothetical protein M0804_013969 [Polistes exclamans]